MQVSPYFKLGGIFRPVGSIAKWLALLLSVSAGYSPAVVSDENDVTRRSEKLQSEYVEACINISFFESIQLARTPARRKSKRVECIESKWMDRYIFELEDRKYQTTYQSDAMYREGLVHRAKLPFYKDRLVDVGTPSEMYLQTKSLSQEKRTKSQNDLESLNGYDNIYPSNN